MRKQTADTMTALGWKSLDERPGLYLRDEHLVRREPIDWGAEPDAMLVELEERVEALKRERTMEPNVPVEGSGAPPQPAQPWA